MACHSPGGFGVPDESERSRLIGDICRLVHERDVPDDIRKAALTMMGWLARRMPGESAHALGVEEAVSERRVRVAPTKGR